MARQPRVVVDEGIYHVHNRGKGRIRIFQKPADFEGFINLLEEGRKKIGVRILGYCLMDNHWHLVLWPKKGRDLSRFVGWVCTTQVRRWVERRGSGGPRDLYQGRYKNFLVQPDEHFLSLMRYIESNPLRAKRVRRAEDWPWSSLGGAAGSGGGRVDLAKWPVDRPRDWKSFVNKKIDEDELERLRVSVRRQRPFGGEKWVGKTVARMGLESTVRDPWRPRKKVVKQTEGRRK